jgi:DNA-binding response OmpR family regulator
LLTSVGRKGDAAIAIAAGFSAYLIKPVPWSELYDALVEVMRGPGAVARRRLRSSRATRSPRRAAAGSACARRGRSGQPLVTEWALQPSRLRVRLGRAGFRGDRCLLARSLRPDLDGHHMPDMDGYKTTAALRARERGVHGRRSSP